MWKLLLIILFLFIFSCFKTYIVQYDTKNTNPPKDVSGLQYHALGRNDDRALIFNPATLGRKFFRFLRKYGGTISADSENYFSDFSDVKFSWVTNFISFFNLDNNHPYCKGWKSGENFYDGIKWDNKIKKDQEDVFWFDYDYYVTCDEIEYSITYKS